MPPRKIAIRVVAPPPPPVPEPPPPAPTPEPKPQPIEKPVHERPRPQKQAITRSVPEPSAAEVGGSTTTGDPTAKPKFGVTMESTSTKGTTSVPVGNTQTPTPTGDPGPAKPLPPAAAHEVTRMPLPQGRCAGRYTEEARAAGVEGVVVLDVVVDETGRTRDIEVVEKLTHGLTEAAIAALRACRFSPGEKAGKPVPVRVRGFKIRFLLDG